MKYFYLLCTVILMYACSYLIHEVELAKWLQFPTLMTTLSLVVFAAFYTIHSFTKDLK